ncbi:Uncharacterised protein [Vibrio cholerae]|nr:Uncharacterised protein [Vibrio cholerae]
MRWRSSPIRSRIACSLGCSMRIFAIEVYCALVSGYIAPRTIKVKQMMATPQLPTKV